MGIAKKVKSIIDLDSVFIFLFFVIFPFGQIIRLSFNFAGLTVPLLPLDVATGLGAFYAILWQKEKPKNFKYLEYCLGVAAFSYVLSVFIFKEAAVYGLFYLIRLFAYIVFLNYVWNFVIKTKNNRELLLGSLLGVSVFSAIFGWIQFFTVPDLKPLHYIGWDMHLYRLAGTFLDPTYLGLIIVFGLILSINRLIDSNKRRYLFLIFFLLISLAFTYSRASFLAFISGVFVLAVAKKKINKIIIFIVGLIVIAFLLPTAKNQSIKLTRTFSIDARLQNYKEALTVFQKFPAFGVGYNNFCVARNAFIEEESFSSHACSGSDSSLLLILATTGIIGLMIFGGNIFYLLRSLKDGHNLQIAFASFAALFTHSLFSNSLFYPWVMGYLIILLAATIKK